MSRETKYHFYALTINGRTDSVYATHEEVIDQLADCIFEHDDDRFGIERVNGIWELIKRMGSFEDYDDEWMEVITYAVQAMIEKRKKLLEKSEKEKQEEQGENKS